MNIGEINRAIAANELEIMLLGDRAHEMLDYFDSCQSWSEALHEFQSRHDSQAVPGGNNACLSGLASGDPGAIAIALCFLGMRPYFHRLRHIYKKLLCRIRRVTLTRAQTAGLELLQELGRYRRTGKSCSLAERHDAPSEQLNGRACL